MLLKCVKKRCFATKWERINKRALKSRIQNYEESKKENFVKDMIDWFEYNLQRPKANNKTIFVRVHTSGDFYNLDYLEKWIKITDHFKDNKRILFQAYTKSMPILEQWLNKGNNINDINIHFVWSIWNDTPKEYSERAKELKLQTFIALPKQEIIQAVNNGSFECKGDCGNCRQCYTGKVKEIVILYH